jgi:hypothetical protein
MSGALPILVRVTTLDEPTTTSTPLGAARIWRGSSTVVDVE